ncbi:hypothetical protein WS46_28355 [Burkholderia sp. RF4-BP95]|nr:hypothetical protein WS46_28355 [Burkholderia sp. RF4-BP95]
MAALRTPARAQAVRRVRRGDAQSPARRILSVPILGASWSGKSTFLRCLNLLETPDDGSVALAGETLAMKRARDGKLHPSDYR